MKQTLNRLLVAAGILLLAALAWYRPYQGLYVHMGDASWSEVTVESSNMPQPLVLKSKAGSSTLKVNGLSHGVYDIRVRFHDGKVLYATLFQYDAGIRQRLDVYIERVPGTEIVKVKEYANKIDLVFRGEKKASQTTEKKPLQMDWI